MKRSEMVINMAIVLMSRLPEWEKEERLKFADEILLEMEIEGMLPPTDYWNGLVPEWEPEDDA